MTDSEEVFDSPKGWVAKHIRGYVESDGRKGHRWNGVDTLLLTTHGRRTGKHRRTALIYGRDGDRYLVVASSGGAKSHPSWYLNLVANPEVTIELGAETFQSHATTVEEPERTRLYDQHAAEMSFFDGYRKRVKTRQIPVVVFEGPPGVVRRALAGR